MSTPMRSAAASRRTLERRTRSPKGVVPTCSFSVMAFGQGLEYNQTVIGEFAQRAAAEGVAVANTSVAGHFFKNQIELTRWLIDVKGVRPKVILLCLTPRFLGNPDAYSDAFIYNGSLFGTSPGRGAESKSGSPSIRPCTSRCATRCSVVPRRQRRATRCSICTPKARRTSSGSRCSRIGAQSLTRSRGPTGLRS